MANMPPTYTKEEIENAHKVLFDEGLRMRYQVAGKEYVDKALSAGSTSFARSMQEYVTESCWGSIWTRPGLDLKVRSFLNIAMLCCQNRSTELGVHVKGALNNGATEDEIREVVLQAACYCGMPSGIEGFKVAARVIEEHKAEQKRQGGGVIGGDGARHEDVDIGARMKLDDV